MADAGFVDGDLCTNGRGTNSRRQAIGTSTKCMGVIQHAFLWENTPYTELSALILPGSDIEVVDMLDIDDRGGLPWECSLTATSMPSCWFRPAMQAQATRAHRPKKQAQVVALLKRSGGATLQHLMRATGWRAHSVRGFISGALGKRLRLKIESFKTARGPKENPCPPENLAAIKQAFRRFGLI